MLEVPLLSTQVANSAIPLALVLLMVPRPSEELVVMLKSLLQRL